MPHFSYLILKWGILKSEHKKVGHFKKKHAINFKTEKEPKRKFFDFGAFEKMHMPSRKHIYLSHAFGVCIILPVFIILMISNNFLTDGKHKRHQNQHRDSYLPSKNYTKQLQPYKLTKMLLTETLVVFRGFL